MIFILLALTKTMEMMGDKITARQTVHSAGVPVIPGSTDAVNSVEEIKELAKDIGYPLVLPQAVVAVKVFELLKKKINLKNH